MSGMSSGVVSMGEQAAEELVLHEASQAINKTIALRAKRRGSCLVSRPGHLARDCQRKDSKGKRNTGKHGGKGNGSKGNGYGGKSGGEDTSKDGKGDESCEPASLPSPPFGGGNRSYLAQGVLGRKHLGRRRFAILLGRLAVVVMTNSYGI